MQRDEDPSRHRGSVLVLEDDATFCNYLVGSLHRLGLQATGVPDAEGLLGHSLADFDLLVVDLNLPGVHGIDILELIAQSPSGSDVLIVSGEQERTIEVAEAHARALGVRVIGSLTKPVSHAVLTGVIERWLDSRSGEAGPYPLDSDPIAQFSLALNRGAISPHFQPRLDAMSGALHGFEVLARAPGYLDDTISTARLMATIGEHDEINLMFSEYIIDAALDTLKTWAVHGQTSNLVINMFARSFLQDTFADRIHERVAQHGVDPGTISLEFESPDLRTYRNRIRGALARLSLHGFQVSISLGAQQHWEPSFLQGLGCSEVTMDVEMLHQARSTRRARMHLEEFVEALHEEGMILTCSQVEEAADVPVVQELGADLLQGFLIAPALPADEALGMLGDWTPPEGLFQH